ncbi:hypothetical protein NCCP133_27940 [Cytobacillus sp. NCCP-133]|nr:hypothetical protein NCCP133_27940 [Cytobacillus sp. NCCP-133]
MNKTEMLKLFVLIERVYPGFRIKNDIVHYYFGKCEELEYERALSCIKGHIRKYPYPPSISSIAAECLRQETSLALRSITWQEEYMPASELS